MITQTLASEFIRVDFETGIAHWKTRDRKHFNADRDCDAWNAKNSGRELNSVNGSGYKRGAIFGVSMRLHRLIWLIAYGYLPGIVKHIDHDRLNNRLTNLEEVTPRGNSRNHKLHGNNTSGCMGVIWFRNKWQARIVVLGVIKYLGVFKHKSDAITARKAAEVKYGFHANHGIQLNH